MRFRRSPDLSTIPTEGLLAELRSRGLFVSAERRAPGKVEISTATYDELIADLCQTSRNFVALVDKHGDLLDATEHLRTELDAERSHAAWLRGELGIDEELNELLEGEASP